MKPICGYCKFWGDGSGTGNPYDAGHMNDCNNPQISGDQHPSYGVCVAKEKQWFTFLDLKSNLSRPESHLAAICLNKQSRR